MYAWIGVVSLAGRFAVFTENTGDDGFVPGPGGLDSPSKGGLLSSGGRGALIKLLVVLS
jgi:hypothetical protein